MSIQEARRVAFEEWWESEMNLQEMDLHRCEFPMQKPDFVQPYACHETQRAFLSWNAALDLVVVSLPGRVGYEHVYDEVGMKTLEPEDDRYADESFALVRAIEVQEAIEAAGIRVEVKS